MLSIYGEIERYAELGELYADVSFVREVRKGVFEE